MKSKIKERKHNLSSDSHNKDVVITSQEIQNIIIDTVNKIRATNFSLEGHNSFFNNEIYVTQSLEKIKDLVKDMIKNQLKLL